MFDKNGGLQALIQYPDVQTAVVANEALEGHCIDDGGFCNLHISYSRHNDLSINVNNDQSRDYTLPSTPPANSQPSIPGQQPVPMGGGAPAHQYNGPQFAHRPPEQSTMHQPPAAGWGAVPPASQSTPLMVNHPYMPMPMGQGMMQMRIPGQSGMPHHAGPIPPPRPDHM